MHKAFISVFCYKSPISDKIETKTTEYFSLYEVLYFTWTHSNSFSFWQVSLLILNRTVFSSMFFPSTQKIQVFKQNGPYFEYGGGGPLFSGV